MPPTQLPPVPPRPHLEEKQVPGERINDPFAPATDVQKDTDELSTANFSALDSELETRVRQPNLQQSLIISNDKPEATNTLTSSMPTLPAKPPVPPRPTNYNLPSVPKTVPGTLLSETIDESPNDLGAFLKEDYEGNTPPVPTRPQKR